MNAITFSLVAPIFLLLTFGAMEGGRVLSAWLVITNEAREAARFGAVNYGRTDVDLASFVQGHVYDRVGGVLTTARLTPAPAVVVSNSTPAQVGVTISYQVDLVVPIVNRVLPNPVALVARSTMRGE